MDEQQIRALVSERGSMRLSELLALAKPADRALVELRVLHMAKRGTLRVKPVGKDMLLFAETLSEGAEAAQFVEAEVAIVATLPLGGTIRRARLPNCIDMLEALTMLITGAKRELRISSPFADPETIAMLAPSFRKAAGKGITVKFLTRSEENQQLLAALRAIYNTYAKLGIPDKFSVKWYEERVTELLVEAVHAKVVISDDDMAYVGSGELRKHSLTADVEIGVLLRGAVVRQLVDLFDAVWGKAKSIKLTNF